MYNYKNSKYFIKCVKNAREFDTANNNLAIFAGACQSYYEWLNLSRGLILLHLLQGILIDFVDPLVVAETIATADSSKFVTIRDFENKLRDGQRGISGIGTKGKKHKKMLIL